MNIFGSKIKEIRDEYGLNQEELAARLGLAKPTISKYEIGAISPSLEVMLKIKEIYGKSLDWQMGYEETKESKYNRIIEECEKSDVPVEKIVDILKILKN